MPELEVGHVYINDPVQDSERLKTVVAARIVDERKPEASVDCDGKRCKDLGNNVGRRDEVYIVASLSLQLEHDVCKLARIAFGANRAVADVAILTERAEQVAA